MKQPAFGKISDSRDFQAVLSGRCGRTGDHLRMMARPNGLPYARLGLVVGRKVCPTAVGRNYMKRVCRELFRRYVDRLEGLDVVILHKKKFVPGTFDLLSAEFEILAQSVQKCRDSFKFSSAPTNSA